LWVNLPAKDKMSTPKYQAIANATIPVVTLPDNGGVIEVIAGKYHDVQGAATTFTTVNLLNAKLNHGGIAAFNFPASYNTVLLVIEGTIKVNGEETVDTDHLTLFANEGEAFTIEALEDSVVLILSGEPINEPIVAHGPFVMNTQQEIVQAIQDYNLGKFGFLEE
jgi:redox-sensitive bicupin YhaK (pirin superfamily)